MGCHSLPAVILSLRYRPYLLTRGADYVTSKTITRVELADAIVREVGITRQESGDILDRMLELIGKSLEHENEVKLSRFGNFVVRKKSARAGRNPKTGVEAKISARRVVTFKPSPMLKSKVEDGN